MVTLKTKLEDWAKDRNDFFCIHDVTEFFRDTEERVLTSQISQMKATGILTKTDVKQGCTRHDRKHSFYIYNKRRAIPTYDDSHLDEQAKPKVEPAAEMSKTEIPYIYGKLSVEIYNTMKRLGTFCVHDMIRATGKKMVNMAGKLNDFEAIGIISKSLNKNTCKDSQRNHFLYKFNENAKIKIMEREESIRLPIGKTTQDVMGIAKGLGTFCIHDIAKARNTKISNVSSLLTDLTRKGIIVRLPQLADCANGKQRHIRYQYKGIEGEEPKEEKKTTRKKAKRISKRKSSDEPTRKATYNLRIEQPKMNMAEMFAKAKWRTETCPCCGKKVTIMEIHE